MSVKLRSHTKPITVLISKRLQYQSLFINERNLVQSQLKIS